MLGATARSYRNAYTGLSRSTWLLSLVMLINRSGTMVIPFMTLYLTSPKMGYSVGQAGVVFAMFGLGAFSGAYFGGKLTDKIGFYPVQLITLSGGGLLFMILGQMHTYWLICLFTYILSFVNEAFRPANSTAIAFYSSEENRTRSYSLNRLAINLGWAVGSSVGGILASINYELLFWVDGFTNLTAALIMWFFLKPVDYKPVRENTGFQAGSQSAYKDRTYIYFIILTTLFASCFFQLFTNLPVFFRDQLHLSKPFIGMLMAVNGMVIAIIEMALIYRLEGKRTNLSYIKTGILLISLSFLVLCIPGIGRTVAFCMILLVTVGEMLAMPFMNSYWISRTRPHNRGQYAALYTMAWSTAQTIGPAGAAQVAEHGGFRILWLIIAAICLVVVIFMGRISER